MSRRRKGKRLAARPEAPPSSRAVGISLIRYSKAELEERSSLTPGELDAARRAPGVKWVNIDGVHDLELLELAGRVFGIHPLTIEDIGHPYQRAKIEDYGGYVYACVKMLHLDEQKRDIESEQLSIVFGRDYVITFQEEEHRGDVFGELRQRIRGGSSQLRASGSDHLFYWILDAVVDDYFVILESHEEQVAAIEDELDEGSAPDSLQGIHELKKRTIELRRNIWPLRELAGHLERGEWPLVSPELKLFVRDLYDHVLRLIETTESARDILGTMHDLSLSLISNRMNRVMKLLTIISTIFIPLTFIAGVYGMNFHNMPEIAWRWGYPTVLGGMLLIALTMLLLFRRNKWF